MTDRSDRATRPEGTRSIEAIQDDFRSRDYIADRSVATAVFLALELGRPLLLEGEAGVGKTELAKVLAASLGTRLIRLQCYEGLDVNTAVYEWNYPRQMLEIRLLEARGEAEHATAHDIFGADFLIRRPLLQALESTDGVAPVLLIDEIDRADEEFEAYLLEILSDFQITVPEIGTIKAETPPQVRDAVIDALGKRFSLLERQPEGKTYLTGERFTIVDAYAYVVLNWTNYHKIDVDPWPGLKTFLQRVKERPAVQQARREEGLPV